MSNIKYGCQQVLLHLEAGTQAILEYLCSESNKVYNSALYYARQVYFKTNRLVNRAEICSEMARSKNRHFGAMYVSSAQQTCNSVTEALRSFRELMKLWRRSELIALTPFSATAEVIDEICQAYVSWRYGGRSPNLTQLNLRLKDLNNLSSIPKQQG
jgi:hypothetical protein